MTKILFVCMGNICRSPTAEAVFRKMVTDAGLEDSVVIASAGTHAYHVGEPADVRAQQAARKRGFDLGEFRARQITQDDFREFDAATVPDPYYGGPEGFGTVLDYVEDACQGLLDVVRKRATMYAAA